MTRKFSSISVATTLASGISNSATTMTVATGTGTALMGGVTLAAGNVDQFTVAIDPDTINEEIVFVTAVASDTLTVVRGRAGSSAIAHTGGAAVKHVLTSDDLTAFTTAISPVTSVGFAGSTSGTTTVQATAIAGTTTLTLPAATDTVVARATTDTLTNKTINSSNNTLVGIVTPTSTDTLTNKTLTAPVATVALNAQTGTTYTFVLSDASKFVTCSNASAIAVSIPTNASVAFPTGTVINVQQIGAGQVTIAAATPGTTTVTSAGITSATPKTRAQYSAVTCIKTGTDTWTVVGDIV
jgi:hypothetical protein